jgi:hypothetical protein
VFSGKRGKSYAGDIAIDDVQFLKNSRCPPPGIVKKIELNLA